MRRVAVIAVLGALVAGCGGEETVTPTAETVIGQQPQPQPQPQPQGDPQAGKAVFAAKGCGGCHTFQPAGPAAKGTTGPDLDNLQQYAERAGQPLDEFVRESITQPDAYIEPGFPEGVMPAWSGTEKELSDLVAFLTQQ